MSGNISSGDVYVINFLDSVGKWVKDYCDRNQLTGYTLNYIVSNITHDARTYYILHFELVGYSDSVDIGNIAIDTDTTISEQTLPNAGFSYIKKDLREQDIQSWDSLSDEPIQHYTPVLTGFTAEHWPRIVGNPFISNNYLTNCVNMYKIIYGEQAPPSEATLAWLSMERLIDLLNTTGITQL